ncbi:protein LKAAEAR1 isoform X2 [Antechinus flavipes]|uniref:protein LKAAEAR1 isoform X2 n=1 Tax=Antechinus flavipes TaxID=38775 RepID=UPI0022355CD3|nr:protein LKAAEAR1 isoform X2 [Antechinus flavipes]
MPGAHLLSEKRNKQKRTISIKKEIERLSSAAKEAVAENETEKKKTAATLKLPKEWDKVMVAKTAAKTMLARTREEAKIRRQWRVSAYKGDTVLKTYPDDLLPKDITSLSPAEIKRFLLFVEPTKVSASDSTETIHSCRESKHWDMFAEPVSEQQKRLIGVLKASEARNRIRALRLRYTRMRAEEIKHLISRQKTARAAIRLELFLPPHLNPTKIPDCLDRRERHRVEAILEEKNSNAKFR